MTTWFLIGSIAFALLIAPAIWALYRTVVFADHLISANDTTRLSKTIAVLAMIAAPLYALTFMIKELSPVAGMVIRCAAITIFGVQTLLYVSETRRLGHARIVFLMLVGYTAFIPVLTVLIA